MREENFRNKISWMMFLFSLFVIWVHAYNIELFSAGQAGALWETADRIETIVSGAVGQTAVPGFFLLSSYLFFRTYRPEKLLKKWKERVHSVLIPYIAWNSIYYFGYAAASRLPSIHAIVGKPPVPLGFSEYLDAILHYSYAPVFWYLYQLIILIILSPVIYLLVKNKLAGLFWLAFLAAAVHFHWDTQHPNTDALFYYSAAAWAAVHGKAAVEAAWNRRRALFGGVGFLIAAACFAMMRKPGADVLWTVLYRFFVPVSLWLLLPEKRLFAARPWMKLSLYLYAVHYIIVRFVNKGAGMVFARMFGQETVRCAAALGIYFLLPGVVLLAAYVSALILGKYFPRLWRLLSGGRSIQ